MPFAPGQSGNPKGRPKQSESRALRRIISRKQRTKHEIIDFYFSLMRGEIEGLKPEHREKGAAWLAKWKYGEAPSVVPVDDKAVLRKLDPEFAKLLKFPGKHPDECPGCGYAPCLCEPNT